MKKLISLFLCALMVMSLFATAFAAPIGSGIEPVSPYSVTDEHIWTLYNATCNGTKQTWYYICAHAGCNAHKSEVHACPGAGHSSACHWLPI
ncbi:MAG: hypothetical protein HDT35_05705 [Clostridiales bacterium]|nr:hypothetical protein [Clostridiales bacterium]